MKEQALRSIAQEYGTPAYLFDLDLFTDRIHWLKRVFGSRVKICYAMKANPFLTQAAAMAADGVEVCSPGEFAICRRAGLRASSIVLSGVNKEPDEIESVMRMNGAGRYTVESLNQLELLESCASKTETFAVPVLLRVSSGNQFGMEEEMISDILSEWDNYPHLDCKGLQYYSGTQKKNVEKINQEIHRLDDLCTRIKNELGMEIQELEYGPGFYVPYFQGEESNEKEGIEEFKKTLDSLVFRGKIVLEMGRFLAASCGSYLTRIADTKRNMGQNYCIVDGGIHHINYYGQTMAMKIPSHRFLPQIQLADTVDLETEGWIVCGSLCTSGDILVKNLPLPGARVGDLLVFDQIGAYSVTEGIYLFLSRKLPCVLLHSKQDGVRMVRDAVSTDLLNY